MSPIKQLQIDTAQRASVCRRYHVVELSVFGSVALPRRPVDLVPKEGLEPAIRGEVLAEAQTLYAA